MSIIEEQFDNFVTQVEELLEATPRFAFGVASETLSDALRQLYPPGDLPTERWLSRIQRLPRGEERVRSAIGVTWTVQRPPEAAYAAHTVVSPRAFLVSLRDGLDSVSRATQEVVRQVGDAVGQQIVADLAASLPAVPPRKGDCHHGVDRSVDPTHLAGQRVRRNRGNILEGLQQLLYRIARDGGRPDVVLCGPGAAAELGWIRRIQGPVGPADIHISQYLHPLDVYALTTSDWRLLMSTNGVEVVRSAVSADELEIHLAAAALLVCLNPATSGRLVVAETGGGGGGV